MGIIQWALAAGGKAKKGDKYKPGKGAAGSAAYDDYALDKMFQALSSIPDPDAMLKQAGIRREKLRVMEFDDEIGAALETRREAAVSTPWHLEPNTGQPAEFVTAELTPLMDSILRGVWNAIPYGYSVVEAVYVMRDGGRVGLARANEKPFEWFEPRNDGRLIYHPPDGGQDEEVDTTVKFFFTVRNPAYRNPYGEALLSRIYWPWQFRHNAWKSWMQFVERFGDPLLIGRSHDPTKMVEELRKLGVVNILATGSNDELSAVTQSGSGEFSALESALNRRIQKIILGQTLTSEVGATGSFAAAKVHDQVRQEKRNADLRLIRATMQRIVDALWRLNNFGDTPPQIIIGDMAGLEKDRAERDSVLVNAGAVQLTEDYLLRVYDYQQGDIIIPKPGEKTLPKEPGKLSVELAATRGQEAADSLALDAMNRVGDGPIPLDKLRAAILGAGDYADLQHRLGLLIDSNSREFADVLARAQFAADVLGYVNADEGVS